MRPRLLRRSLLGRRSERGAVLVEAAFVLPVIIMLTFGMLEMGLFFKDSLTLSEATKDAAHTGAQWAQDPAADFYILKDLQQAALALNGNIVEVIVYDAAAPDPLNASATNVPANCVASATGVDVPYTDSGGVLHATGGIGSCNVYITANGDLAHPLTDFTGTPAFSNSQHWPGGSRLQNLTDVRYPGGGPGPDYVGVWVKTTHNWTTGIVQTSPTDVTEQAVFRIEPRQ